MKELDEKKKVERHWKAYKQKNGNGLIVLRYGLVFVGLGGLVFLGGIQEKDMYQILKDDEYLTDDGLPYRDMANATYTYPVEKLDEMAEQSNWMIFAGAALMGASVVVTLAVAWVIPEKKEIHSMLCRQWQDEQFAGKDGPEDMTYCPECGLKLSRLEKD